MELVGDLYQILLVGWDESEQRFLFLLFVIVIFPIIAEIRDRYR